MFSFLDLLYPRNACHGGLLEGVVTFPRNVTRLAATRNVTHWHAARGISTCAFSASGASSRDSGCIARSRARARMPCMHAKTAFNRSRARVPVSLPLLPPPRVICGNYGRTGTENSRLSRAAPRRELLHDWISTVSRIWRAPRWLTPFPRAPSVARHKTYPALPAPLGSRHRAAVSGTVLAPGMRAPGRDGYIKCPGNASL